MNEQTEQRRYEVAKDVLAAIHTNPSKYGNSPESMRDAARHAIKQADAFLDMLGREKAGQSDDPVEIVAEIMEREEKAYHDFRAELKANQEGK